MTLSGCGTALVTPFRGDGGLDEETLSKLVDWQIESGIRFLVACGTTAETPTLTHEEWLRVIRIVTETAAGRVPVLAGCTHNSTVEAVARAGEAASIPGVSGLLTANPFYNKPGQEGQYRHFRAIAEAVPCPVVIYNIPSRTGANLEPATILRLAEDVPNIQGVKESSGNLQQIAELIHRLPSSFAVLSGDDLMTLPVIALGGAGLVSVASNEIPRPMARMVAAALQDDWTTARALYRRYFPLITANFWEPSPGPVKCMMTLMGRIQENYRLPIVPVTSATREKLKALAEELGLLT
ncbi:MAG TPA: 4-hydroxy-tetrahydrodipicolinate synthase [Acidobacteriaceae bacterium]|jgi:4-hydroxy-tetrahydrodipicolinate synthase|nr:4-hydroxy-tetrahydrodipicolinate synthase [Acidobacteriaceae bacterium]